jgi:menaquinone-dependent protoporphyrinogen oxidase
MKVLVTAATKYGATGEIAKAIGDVLVEHGLDTAVIPPGDVGDVKEYEAVVLGSAVYAGHWLELAKALLHRSGRAFAARAVWLFSSGPVGDRSRKLVQKMGEDPVDLAKILEATRAREHRMFAGKLERKNLSFPQRAALTVFRGVEGDFRDWSEIRTWASIIADALGPG